MNLNINCSNLTRTIEDRFHFLQFSIVGNDIGVKLRKVVVDSHLCDLLSKSLFHLLHALFHFQIVSFHHFILFSNAVLQLMSEFVHIVLDLFQLSFPFWTFSCYFFVVLRNMKILSIRFKNFPCDVKH